MSTARIDCFLDTNILIYAAQVRTRDERRTAIARDLVLSTLFGISAQTLAEFYSVTTRKAHVALTPSDTDNWMEFLSAMPLQAVDQPVVMRGIELSRWYDIAYYDAALLAAAERLGAVVFYTEDLNHDQLFGSVRAINPFLEH